MFAITPYGVGRPVGARRIRDGWPLVEGETFTVTVFDEALVLAEDEVSLRPREPGDPPVMDQAANFDADMMSHRVLRVLFEVMLDQEVRLRALEGRPAITRAQALQALKNIYTGLNGQ